MGIAVIFLLTMVARDFVETTYAQSYIIINLVLTFVCEESISYQTVVYNVILAVTKKW